MSETVIVQINEVEPVVVELVVQQGPPGAEGPPGPAGGATWGNIDGTLSDQTDLQLELDAKAPALTSDQNYVSDAELSILQNTSGVNTGDQDLLGLMDLVPNHIQFDTAPDAVPASEGVLHYDPTAHTLDLTTDVPGATLNIGREDWTRIKNNTGSIILDGSAVVGSGVDGDVFEVSLALASVSGMAGIAGIVTAEIGIGEEGWATTRGVVHDYDTSAFSALDFLYVSDTVPGGLTSMPPIPPSYTIPIGYAMNSQVGGSIYVFSTNPAASMLATDTATATGDPTGFAHPETIDVAYDPITRTITLTDTLIYFWKGQQRQLVSPWTSDPHPTTLDVGYFLLSTDGINFTWETAPWTFDQIQVAYVWYGTIDKYALRECHGLMPWQAHQEFHQIVGTYKQSGGTLADYVLSSTTAANRRPSVAATLVKDEDITTTNAILAPGGPYTQMSLTGAGTNVFAQGAADIVALLGDRPYYNAWDGSQWIQTQMSTNSYMSVWLVAVPAASDVNSQAFRYIWIEGQTNGNLSSEQNAFPESLSLGTITSLFSEFVFTAKVIIRYTGGHWRIQQVQNLTGTRQSVVGSAGGVYLSSVAHDSSLDGTGTVTDPLFVTGFLPDVAEPATPVGGGILYVEAGSLKYKGSSGTITVLGLA